MRLRFLLLLVIGILGNAALAETPQDHLRIQYKKIVEESPQTLSTLTQEQLARVLTHVSEHPVASLASLPRYDHQPTGIGNREIGFCFGRAMAVHLTARRMGLFEDSIRKIFLAGDLKNGTIRWRFHMATLLKGDDNQYYVVDPIMPTIGQPGVSTPAVWMDAVKRRFDLGDGIDESKFYLTDTSAIMVDMANIPASVAIENALFPLIGDRLINVTFAPDALKGFDAISVSEIPTDYPLFAPNESARLRYFVNLTEPDFNGKPVFNFDFFRFSTVIFYQADPTIPGLTALPRTYDYNNYFRDLTASFHPDIPIPSGD